MLAKPDTESGNNRGMGNMGGMECSVPWETINVAEVSDGRYNSLFLILRPHAITYRY